MIKVYDSATIRFVQGTAIFSDTSILIESPPPVDLDDEVISDEGMNSAADLSNHEIVQLSLEQQDEAELLPEDGLLDLFDVDTAAAEQHDTAAEQHSARQHELIQALYDMGSHAAEIWSCDDLAASYAASEDQQFSLVILQDIITCAVSYTHLTLPTTPYV